MKNKVMIGLWRCMIDLPPSLWGKKVFKTKAKFEGMLGFMSQEHRLVHHFVVRELPYAGQPLSPEFVADKLGLPVNRVNVILNDLQEHMTFLFRNSQGAVVWAYPVTVEKTPHHVTFSTGEQLYAA
ncbi:MAG: hypothetical protein HY913_23645 [Desulfomonile tiedjei]|nr:hypothetical protein [Desulfomonile tiedjei]